MRLKREKGKKMNCRKCGWLVEKRKGKLWHIAIPYVTKVDSKPCENPEI